MTATPEGLARWADERGLACRAAGFGRGLTINEAVTVWFREAHPALVVEWGDGDHAEFNRGATLDALTGLIAGLLALPPEAAPEQPPALGQRVTSVLIGAGFRNGREPNPEHFPAFVVTEGAIVTVGVRWLNANDKFHALLLGKYEGALRAAGLKVILRDGYLLVSDPEETASGAATAAGEGSR